MNVLYIHSIGAVSARDSIYVHMYIYSKELLKQYVCGVTIR